MILLLAFSPRDGVAVVRGAGRWWLIEPPYDRADRREISEDLAGRSVLDQGLPVEEREYADWGELTRDLLQRRQAAFSAEERQRAGDSWISVLKRTTVERAWKHLARLETWVDAGDGANAMRVAVELLKAPAVSTDPVLVKALADLMGRAQQRQTRLREHLPRDEWPVPDEARLQSATHQVGAGLFASG